MFARTNFFQGTKCILRFDSEYIIYKELYIKEYKRGLKRYLLANRSIILSTKAVSLFSSAIIEGFR